jgi:hypothetical protein
MEPKPTTGPAALLRLALVLAVLLGMAWVLNKLLDLIL